MEEKNIEDSKYLNKKEEIAYFGRLKRARIAAGKKKNFELYGIGNEDDLAALDEVIRDGEEAMKQLPELYGDLVSAVLAKYKNAGIPFGDLHQEGMEVLYGAVESYDCTKSRFTTYLSGLLKNKYDTMVQHDGLLTENNWARQNRLEYNAALASLAEKGISKPSNEEIAAESGLTVDKVRFIQESLNHEVKGRNFISLDRQIKDDEDGRFIDSITDSTEPFDAIISEYTTEIIQNAISTYLTPNEALAIRDRYGLNEESMKITRDDIAKKLSLTATDVRMLERSALKKLSKVKEFKGLL